MKRTPFFLFLLWAFLLVSCSQQTTSVPTATVTLTATTPPLYTVEVQTTTVPDVREAARAYLDAWVAEDYPQMYTLLTSVSQDAITQEDFEKTYRDVAAEAALSHWEYELLSSLTNPRSAQVGYRVTMHSVLVGDFQRETQMNLSLETGSWRVQWDPTLILPELRTGNYLRMEYRSPARANIYDRNGQALVAQADAVAIGLNTGLVDPATQNALLEELFRLTGVRPERLAPQIENYRAYGWYLPVADISVEDLAPREAILASYGGVILQPFRARYYFNGGIAPHVIGYVSAIQADEVETYKRLGYNVWGDRVGQKGLEWWGESYLAGKRGGVLYLVGPDGNIITRLAESSPEPSQAIYTTIDKDLQLTLQQTKAISDGFQGAIVVLERDTGRVLAMVSSPGFNPNLFEPQNYNYSYLINDLFDPLRLPLLNRATQGQYPLGSVFKVITLSAALESGIYTPASGYYCDYFFTELDGVRLNDWTYDRYLRNGTTQPSGQLNLLQGLIRSCNPWFWHIGLDFYRRGLITAVSDMARSFGLGSLTGIEIPEETGNYPDPASELDATNLAIGQGASLVTPLQVASFMAAIGNGGTLYTPSVVERITPPDGSPTYVFTATVRGTLPISTTVLLNVQEAMRGVIRSQSPRGTAYDVLNGFSSGNGIPIGGKTGTAQSGAEDPHAWFAGYTDANRANRPDIAIAVLVEYSGEGSEIAAPIFRRVVEIYFGITPLQKYPWEARVGVLPTPTPVATDTPLPPPPGEEPTPTPNGE